MNRGLQALLAGLGPAIGDPEGETFLLFSQSIPSQNLGFVDQRATSIEITVAGREFTIYQSPDLLSSNRDGGTTGAVIWTVTPLFAEWIASGQNSILQASILSQQSTVIELGCGVSGILALTMAPKLGRYIATDQDYVFKILRQNLSENAPRSRNGSKRSGMHHGKNTTKQASNASQHNIDLVILDWETSVISSLPSVLGDGTDDTSCNISAVIACDCIYNEALVESFVRTCAELCQLKISGNPTLCVIAQQLRSNIVFEAWLLAFHKLFFVWRVPEHQLIDALKEGSGFAIHIGILRTAIADLEA